MISGLSPIKVRSMFVLYKDMDCKIHMKKGGTAKNLRPCMSTVCDMQGRGFFYTSN